MRISLFTAAAIVSLGGLVGTGFAANTETTQPREREEIARLGGRVFSSNDSPTEAAIVLAIEMPTVAAERADPGAKPSRKRDRQKRPTIRFAQTDNLGKFQFFDLPPGRYVLLAIHGHHSPGRSAPVVVGKLPSPFPLRITLGGQPEII